MTAPRPVRGVVLFEALVALLLLSMVALAYAGLQLRALREGATTLWDTKALLLASDMADRLRANGQAVRAGQFNAPRAAPQAGACADVAGCTPALMAQAELAQWLAAVSRQLPSGSGVVCLDATPDDGTTDAPGCDGRGEVLAVKVFWRLRNAEQRVVLSMRP